MLWLHMYLSMFGLATVLFFSVTGITLNHPDWFLAGAERRDEAEGRLDPKWLRLGGPVSPGGAGPDRSREVDKLEVPNGK